MTRQNVTRARRCMLLMPRRAEFHSSQSDVTEDCENIRSLVVITQTSLRQKLTVQSTFNHYVIFVVLQLSNGP